MITDLIAGRFSFSFDTLPQNVPHIKAEKLRPLAVTSRARSHVAPDIPTVVEAGHEYLVSENFIGVSAPASLPPAVIAKLHGALVETLADPNVRQRFVDIGQGTWPREQQTAEALAAQQKAEIEKWWPIIKAANIRAE